MSRFGREIARLRRGRAMSLSTAGTKLGVSPEHLYNVERGAKTCGAALAERIADAFELHGTARESFLALRVDIPMQGEEQPVAGMYQQPKRLPVARVTCKNGCVHDGQMAPGGSQNGDEREGDCSNYAECLGAFTKTYKGAGACHCPAHCSRKRTEEPALQAASGWGSFTFPDHGQGKGVSAR